MIETKKKSSWSLNRLKRKGKLSIKEKIMLGLGGFLLLVLLVVWWGLQPIRGTIHFGICKTLAEQHLTYPGTMRVVSYDLLSAYDRAERTMRIYYSYTDAFGESKQDILRCTFEADAQRNMLLTIKSARINRVEIPAEDIARFNATIPAILTYEPDLILPSPPGPALNDLKTD
ncbi:MAG: hypothetical protein KDJ15_02865 [Alphaproteobacteria bacterium]|nr:hypothetical protein [Alphaproteobacteria bacterium]